MFSIVQDQTVCDDAEDLWQKSQQPFMTEHNAVIFKYFLLLRNV